MARRSTQHPPKPPDFPPERTHAALKKQLDALNRLRGRNRREAENDEREWMNLTLNILIHGFGEGSENVSQFHSAKWAGSHRMGGMSDGWLQQNFEKRIEAFTALVKSSLAELELMLPETAGAHESKANIVADANTRDSLRDLPAAQPITHRGLSVFISHSSRDADLALALIELLKAGLGLMADQIRCSSVDGYRLPVGVNTEDKLREEVNAAKVVIGLITPSSLTSYYVMFELGARWGANLFLAPLLAGVKASELRGPLSLLNALSANSDAQLHQLLADIGIHLNLPIQPAASYVRNVSAVKSLADSIENSLAIPVVATPVQQKLKITLSAESTPPSQVLKVVANRQVEVSRVEYMLSNETTIASEEISMQGDSVEIPINADLLMRIWNTPRFDRNAHDHSGPAKIGVTIAADDEAQHYILPIQMDSWFHNNTTYIKLVGSKTFYGS
jgi:hypothetical protein